MRHCENGSDIQNPEKVRVIMGKYSNGGLGKWKHKWLYMK